MDGARIEQLREGVRGEVIAPDDASYDEARRVYNAMIDRRPAVIVRPANTGDVMTAVRFAGENDLPVAVRGGSHSVPGFGTCDDGVVIDLSSRRGVRVDPLNQTARAEGGATWGDFNAATHAFGLATTGGIISTTGVGGLTLGGGIGYLARGLGLSCDNLLSADVVTGDGSFHVASEKEDPALYWAIRGGGGNFGVVTSFEFRLHQLENVYGGPMFFELEHAADVLRYYREVIADAPEQLGGFPAFQIAPPLPFIPEERHGEPFLAFVSCWSGPVEEGEKALAGFRDIAPRVAEMVGPMPYPALNSAFDALVPPGLQHYWKANFVRELTDEAIEAHLVHGPKLPTVNSTVHIYPINGACHRVAPDGSAFAYRDANFATVIAGMWPDPAENEANTAWVRDYYDATAPHSEDGGYVNFMAADDQDRIRANYRQNYDRLAALKRDYDPGNLFRYNQNIAPA
jgi:FAD/FMN-containing dehydrogenase